LFFFAGDDVDPLEEEKEIEEEEREVAGAGEERREVEAFDKEEEVSKVPDSDCGVDDVMWPFEGEVKLRCRAEFSFPSGDCVDCVILGPPLAVPNGTPSSEGLLLLRFRGEEALSSSIVLSNFGDREPLKSGLIVVIIFSTGRGIALPSKSSPAFRFSVSTTEIFGFSTTSFDFDEKELFRMSLGSLCGASFSLGGDSVCCSSSSAGAKPDKLILEELEDGELLAIGSVPPVAPEGPRPLASLRSFIEGNLILLKRPFLLFGGAGAVGI
jgi:hypothetical protein